MGDLIERTAETAALADALAHAVAGAGSSVLLAGPAGVGKTALLLEASGRARAAGFVVLTSSPTPVSAASLQHGVVRDWIGPLVRTARPGARPLDGPAAGLADALRGTTAQHDAWNLAALDYALTWVLESIGEAHPLLLVVDDLQWADTGSLQLLDLLSARVGGLPAALLLARRTGEPSVAPAVLDRITGRALRLEPAPLSVAGVERVRRAYSPAGAVDALPAEELHRRTGGVPFLVHEVLRAGSLEATPEGVVASLRERLGRLGDPALQIARAAAALGKDADLDAVADLTGGTVADLAGPLETLEAAGIVTVDTWRVRPAHPLVAEAVVSAMTPEERSRLHGAAAGRLRASGRPAQVVASHLLHTLPGEDPVVVALLRAAGEESLRSGDPALAARQLLRAAEETRPEDTDPELVALAASAHLQAGRREQALQLWRVALERDSDPVRLARMLTGMGHVQMTSGERDAAAAAFRRAVAVLEAAGHDASSPELRAVLVRMGLSRALYVGARADLAASLADAERRPPSQDTLEDRLLFALAAADLAVRADDRARAHRLARRALAGGSLLSEDSPDGFGFYVAVGVLGWVDAYAESRTVLGAAIDEARRRGSALGFATASYARGLVAFRTGDPRTALADLQPALDLRARGWTGFGTSAVAGAALCHVVLGELPAAAALEPELRAVAAQGEVVTALPMAAAGVVRAAHGDHEAALADYRSAARLLGEHADNPSIVEWRELTAWSLLATGRTSEARTVAGEALERARAWGAPRALGFALRTRARLGDHDEAVPLLREAADLLESCGCADQLARTQADLAARLLQVGGADGEAVSLLRSAFEQARRYDVPPLVRHVSRLLVKAGVPVAELADTPVRLLTPGERRVAELAAAGATNREIAHKLFVTVKAVEWHLSNTYRKLGVSSRRDLPEALYGTGDPSSSSDR